MILFYEKGIRGGITRVICQYVDANNKYIYMIMMNKKHTYILESWLISNNMYKCSLSQPLRYGGFEFAEYLSTFIFDFIMDYNEEDNNDYTLMVGLE